MIAECPRCQGKGEVLYGRIFKSWETCPRCHGSGAVEKLPPYHEQEYQR